MDRATLGESLVRQRVRMLAKALPAATRGDASALHQARVASRRMREALPVLASDDRMRKLDRQIRRITRALGPVRELDVTFQLLDEFSETGTTSRPAIAKLRQALMRERQMLRMDMQRRLTECDVGKLRRRAMAVARKSAAPGRAGSNARERLRRARERAARRAERLRAAIDSAAGLYLPDRLHVVRLGVKKLRYALEVVGEIGASRPTAHLRALKRAQDLLGRMHDLEVLIARTRAVQASPGAPNLKVSADLDRLVRTLETECRRLHGHYVSSREALLKVCDHAIEQAKKRAVKAA